MTDIAGERAALARAGLRMRTREEWGARQDYTSDRRVDSPATGLVLHITVTADPANTTAAENAAFRTVEGIGEARFGIGCSYNAMVTDSCALAEGQPLTRRGAHTVDNRAVFGRKDASLNYAFRSIALVQNVQDDVTNCQVHAIAQWGAALKLAGLARRDAPWYGHRDFAYKSCPGDTGYAQLPTIRRLTDQYMRSGLGGGLPSPTPPEEDDDMKMRFVQRSAGTAKDARRSAVYLVDGLSKMHINTPAALNEAKMIFASELKSAKIEQWPAHWVDALVPKRPGVDDKLDR